MFEYATDELRLIRQGARPQDSWRLLRMAAYLHLRIGRARKLTTWMPARARMPQWDVTLRNGATLRFRPSDAGALFAVLGLGEYGVDLRPLGELRSLLDLGANIGLATLVLAPAFTAPDIVCVEPDEDSFTLLVENLRRNVPAAEVVHAAVAGRAGRARVLPAHFPGANSTAPAIGEDGVEALTVAQLLDRADLTHVDLLKIDVEGAEREVFADAAAWADRVGAILGEVHPPLTLADAHAQLQPFGFVPLPVPQGRIFDDILFMFRPGGAGQAARP